MFTKEQKNILGISVKENKVLASLKKSKSIFTLSKNVKIPRASLYPIIQKLFQRGFIRSKSVGNRFHFQAISKENLSEMLAKIAIELRESIEPAKIVLQKPEILTKIEIPPTPALPPTVTAPKPKKISTWLKSIFK